MLMIGSCGRSILPLRTCVVVRDLLGFGLDFGLDLIIFTPRLRLMFGLGPLAPFVVDVYPAVRPRLSFSR